MSAATSPETPFTVRLVAVTFESLSMRNAGAYGTTAPPVPEESFTISLRRVLPNSCNFRVRRSSETPDTTSVTTRSTNRSTTGYVFWVTLPDLGVVGAVVVEEETCGADGSAANGACATVCVCAVCGGALRANIEKSFPKSKEGKVAKNGDSTRASAAFCASGPSGRDTDALMLAMPPSSARKRNIVLPTHPCAAYL